MSSKENNGEEIKNLFESIFHVEVKNLNQNLLDEEYKLPTVDYLYFLQELEQRYGNKFVHSILDKGWDKFTIQEIAKELN